MFLMISKYLAPAAEVDAARDDHIAYLDDLEARGFVVTAGRQDPPVGGVIVFDVDTEAEARTLIAEDPYVQRGLAEYSPINWKPTRGPLADWARKR